MAWCPSTTSNFSGADRSSPAFLCQSHVDDGQCQTPPRFLSRNSRSSSSITCCCGYDYVVARRYGCNLQMRLRPVGAPASILAAARPQGTAIGVDLSAVTTASGARRQDRGGRRLAHEQQLSAYDYSCSFWRKMLMLRKCSQRFRSTRSQTVSPRRRRDQRGRRRCS